MNYDEMAQKMMVALMGEDYEVHDPEAYKTGVSIIAAKLEELFPIPEDLETAVAKGFITFKGEVPIDDGYDCGDLIASVVSAVAPLCQKPEVPESLEAAWRGVVPDVIDCLYSLRDPIAQGQVIGDAVSRAFASLLAERDKEIKRLEADINPSKRVKEIIGELNDLLLAKDKRIKELEESRNQGYHERNRLVMFLATIYPAHMKRHPDSDETWEDDWRNIVCVHSPMGQLTWHIHDSEVAMFGFLNVAPDPFPECEWDGHTTEEKYRRLLEVNAYKESPEELKFPLRKRR